MPQKARMRAAIQGDHLLYEEPACAHRLLMLHMPSANPVCIVGFKHNALPFLTLRRKASSQERHSIIVGEKLHCAMGLQMACKNV